MRTKRENISWVLQIVTGKITQGSWRQQSIARKTTQQNGWNNHQSEELFGMLHNQEYLKPQENLGYPKNK